MARMPGLADRNAASAGSRSTGPVAGGRPRFAPPPASTAAPAAPAGLGSAAAAAAAACAWPASSTNVLGGSCGRALGLTTCGQFRCSQHSQHPPPGTAHHPAIAAVARGNNKILRHTIAMAITAKKRRSAWQRCCSTLSRVPSATRPYKRAWTSSRAGRCVCLLPIIHTRTWHFNAGSLERERTCACSASSRAGSATRHRAWSGPPAAPPAPLPADGRRDTSSGTCFRLACRPRHTLRYVQMVRHLEHAWRNAGALQSCAYIVNVSGL